MKNLIQAKYILSALVLAACSGPGSKNPVSDLSDMREKAKLESERGPDAPRVITQYVNKDTVKTQEEATFNNSYVKIEIDKKNYPLVFFENKASTATVHLRVFDPDIKMRLNAKGLPAGATLTDVSTASNPGTYELKWTPPLYTVPATEIGPKVFVDAKWVAELVSAKTETKAATIRGMVFEEPISYSVFKTQEKPSDLAVAGLSDKAEEGQSYPFSVVVTFPGVDGQAPQKPVIGWYKDTTTQVAGTDYQEMDGSRFVDYDSSRTPVEYLDNFKWKFNLVLKLNDKDNAVQVQKAKDGSLMTNSDTTHIRFVLKANSGFSYANASVVRISVKRTMPPAPPAAPPVADAPAAPATPEAPKADAPKADAKKADVKKPAAKKTTSKPATKKAK
jgi:hypothetical protein